MPKLAVKLHLSTWLAWQFYKVLVTGYGIKVKTKTSESYMSMFSASTQ